MPDVRLLNHMSVLTHELWVEPTGEQTLCLAGLMGVPARALLPEGSRLTWTVEANSHFEAMSAYHRHMGWAPYQTGFPSDHDPYPENWRRTQVARGIACTITFTREEEGGRVGRLPDLSSGQYLPHVLLTSGAAEPLGVAFVAGPRGPKAGTPVAAGAQFLYPDTVDYSVLLPGTQFFLAEGGHLVANGVVTAVIPAVP